MSNSVETRKDIETRADIETLLRAFYGKAMRDECIGYLFTEVAQLDLEAHLPTMYDFWESLLYKTGKYRGNAMQVHFLLHSKEPLKPEHFARWLLLFNEAVDAHFAGPYAQEAKRSAQTIADTIQARLARTGRRIM